MSSANSKGGWVRATTPSDSQKSPMLRLNNRSPVQVNLVTQDNKDLTGSGVGGTSLEVP